MSEAHDFWTIDELAAQVALALATDYAGAPNGRIRGVPDLRTIRYYTTLGLLDRPAAMRGRTALYGRKHLLQLVAIKRLQAQGLTLVEIQQRLLGKTEQELAEIAQIPGPSAPPTRQHAAERGSFWKQSPATMPGTDVGFHSQTHGEGANPQDPSTLSSNSAELRPATAPSANGSAAKARRRVAESQPGGDVPGRFEAKLRPEADLPGGLSSGLLQGVPLRVGVALLFAPLRALTADDVQAIQMAAGPLLKYLEKRLLIPVSEKEEP